MVKESALKRGDIVFADFGKTVGHEQSGFRPALVISQDYFNKKGSLCILCPVTSKVKGYPFEVLVSTKDIQGVILCDQIRTLDLRKRKIKKHSTVSKKVLNEVLEKIKIIIS